MKIIKCINILCGRPFQVNQFAASLKTSYQAGVIKCPHCETPLEGNPESLFLTHALSKYEEEKFSAA